MDHRDAMAEGGRIDRRKALGLGAAAAGAAWVAPAILSADAAAAATQPPPVVCTPSLTETWSVAGAQMVSTYPGGILEVDNTSSQAQPGAVNLGGMGAVAPGWSVAGGNVDFVLNNGSYGIGASGFPANTPLVDLYGSQPGTIARTLTCPGGTFATGGYTLQYRFAGSQRGVNAGYTAQVLANNVVIATTSVASVPAAQTNTLDSLPFVVPAATTAITVRFSDLNGSGNVGVLLGGVSVF